MWDGVSHTIDLCLYLGIPLAHGRLRSTSFQHIVDQMYQKLGSWKSELFSWASCLVLIQLVCIARSLYTMHTRKIPNWVISQLDKINRNFLWSDMDGTRSTHHIAWSKVCQPKEWRGLGFRVWKRLTQFYWRNLRGGGWRTRTHCGQIVFPRNMTTIQGGPLLTYLYLLQ